MRIAILAPILAVTVLAGCDGTGVTSDQQNFDSVSQEYNAMRADVLAMSVSTNATMPNRGTATYDGFSTIAINQGTGQNTALVGDATLRADFGNGSLTGNLDNFVGQVNGGEVQQYGGALSIRNGEIGETTAASLTADMNGRIRANDGSRVDIDGGIAGRFRDDGGRNVAGLTAVDTNSTDFFVNGVRQRDGTVNIVAQR